jgi:hypothetical protein
MNDKESKQEASIPTASRINMVTLAELAKWWEDSGYRLKTMSQLISWSMDLLKETLRANNKLPEVEMTMVDANRYLMDRRLFQAGVRTRAAKKIGTGLRFESMREEGYDPREEVPAQYNTIHNKQSVEPSNMKVRNNFSEIIMVPLDDYPPYEYPEGDFGTRDRMIAQLKARGIKSQSEQRAEELERAKMSDLVVKE